MKCRQKDGIDILDDSRIHASTDGSGTSKLTIRDAKPTDSALYSCVAKNEHGVSKSAATLRVAGKHIGYFIILFIIESYTKYTIDRNRNTEWRKTITNQKSRPNTYSPTSTLENKSTVLSHEKPIRQR